jgi:hypothetical protein
MRGINKVILIDYISRDAELRQSQKWRSGQRMDLEQAVEEIISSGRHQKQS